MALRRGSRHIFSVIQLHSFNSCIPQRQLSSQLCTALHLHVGAQSTLRQVPRQAWQQCWSLETSQPAWRHLQTSADRKEEAGVKHVPDARECDDAIEKYSRVRNNYASVRYPSTYKTATQRVIDVLTSFFAALAAVVKYTVSVPSKLWALRLKTREDWARSWAHVKKVVKDEAHHYWVGTKLLAYDVRIASGLALKAARGDTLTRRERKQLMRTTADVFRLVPMVVILVVPFMELALPVLLKVFPNMLPSTFEDKLKKEEELKRRLAVKLEVAHFLQDTVAEMANDIKSRRTGDVQASAEELWRFMNKVRAGAPVDNDELVRFASLFNDELTLDNLDRVQLVSMCQFLGLPSFGTDAFLAGRLRAHLSKVKQDDRLIQQEGLDSLTEDELRTACRARGLRGVYGEHAAAHMRQQLHNWLDLSLNRGLPSSLLLMAQVMAITSRGGAPQLQSVKETLATLPENVIKDVGLEVAVPSTGAEELQMRLDLLQKEQKLIAAELAARKLKMSAAAPAPAAAAPTGASAPAAPAPAGQTQAVHAAAVAAAAAVVTEAAAGAAKDGAAAAEEVGVSAREVGEAAMAAREARMHRIISAIAVLASNSGVASERSKFMELVRREITRLKEESLGAGSPALTFTGGSLQSVRPEDALADDELVAQMAVPMKLEDRVSGILHRIEKELDEVENAIGEALHVIDLDNDGLISREELTQALRFLKANLTEEDLMALLDRLNIKQDGGNATVSVDELRRLAEDGEAAAPPPTAAPTAAPPAPQRPQDGAVAAAAAAAPGERVHIHTL